MGNIVADSSKDPNKSGNLITTTPLGQVIPLGKFINDWALNNYTAHPDFKAKNQLKKRACCTRQSRIPIALPGFDLDPADTNYDTKIKTASFVPVYSVNIPVIPGMESLSAEQYNATCKIEDLDYVADKGSGGSGAVTGINQPCMNFYRTDNMENKGLCAHVLDNRSQYKDAKGDMTNNNAYGPDPDFLYGPSKDERDKRAKNMTNAYVDCNCENSSINVIPSIKANFDGVNQPLEDIIQNSDLRCSANGSYTWKTRVKPITMCISVIKTGNISASGGGNINVKSECNISQNNTADKAASAANAVAAAAVTPTANAPAAVTTIKDQPNNKLSSVNSITATSAPTSSSSLSTGTIIGIAVPVALVALVAIYYLFKQTPAKSNDSED
jgi:hypothetical protein